MDYLRISGRDAASFLQGQSSNDLRALDEGKGIYSAFLSPQARIIDLAYIHKASEQDFYLEVTCPERLRAHLEKFIILADLEINLYASLPDNIVFDLSQKLLEPFAEGDTLIKLDDQYRGMILPKYVSFTKGCFPGQEPLAKFQNIGKPKRQARANAALDEALRIFAEATSNDAPELEQALRLLHAAIQDDPTCEDAYETLGVILARQGKYQEAIKIMQTLEMINPANQMALMNLSIFFMKIGDKETAEEYKAKGTVLQFEKALKQ